MELSIAICTYNRAEYLRTCLESLINQDLRDLEILVVDNNSSDNTQQVISEFQSKYPTVRGYFEIKQGLSHARNKAVEVSSSNWVVFLDDDAYVDHSYIEELRKEIHSGQFQCFGGVYYPWYKFGKKNWYKDSYGSNLNKKFKDKVLSDDSFADGGNCAFSKNLLTKVGKFNIEVGMSGSKISYGEETELQRKARDLGFKIGFNQNIRIYHLVPLHKQSVKWILKSTYYNGKCYWDVFHATATPNQILKIVFAVLRYISIKMPILSIKKILSKESFYPQSFCIDLLIPFFYFVGQIYSGIQKNIRGI